MTPCICEWSRVGAEEDWLHLPNEFPKGLDLMWQLEPVLTEADLIDANDATAIVSYKMFKMGWAYSPSAPSSWRAVNTRESTTTSFTSIMPRGLAANSSGGGECATNWRSVV